MRKLLKKQEYFPDKIVTDKLGSCTAARPARGMAHLHVTGGQLNNRAGVPNLPTSQLEHQMGRFKSLGPMQRLLSLKHAIFNQFRVQ